MKMKRNKIIETQIRLGYLVQVTDGRYRINRRELEWEMERRLDDTDLSVVSCGEYRRKLVALGIKLVS